jgi:hypothetical protein
VWRGRFDVLVVWSIDRFGRSMVGNIRTALELDRLGIEVISVREPWLDTRGPVRELLIAIFSWGAEQERRCLVERTHARLERARRQGKRIGRPPAAINVTAARALRKEARCVLSSQFIARTIGEKSGCATCVTGVLDAPGIVVTSHAMLSAARQVVIVDRDASGERRVDCQRVILGRRHATTGPHRWREPTPVEPAVQCGSSGLPLIV